MSTFSPYVVIEDSATKLHLKESKTRRTVILIVLRFVPFIYLLVAGYLIIYQSERLPFAAVAIIAAALVIAAVFIFTRKMITELVITKAGIDIAYDVAFQQKKMSYPLSFIDHISQRRRGGKAPAYIYYAIIKGDKNKQKIFDIPSVYMSKERQVTISNKLETLTGLKVITDKRFIL